MFIRVDKYCIGELKVYFANFKDLVKYIEYVEYIFIGE